MKRLIKRIRSKVGTEKKPANRPPPKPAETAKEPAKPQPDKPRRRRRRKPRSDRPAEAKTPVVEEPWDETVFQVPEQEGSTRFHDLDLGAELMHAIYDLGFVYCTPVQAQSLPAALAGRDVAGRAQTGTGKTAAFLIRIFQHMLSVDCPPRKGPGSPRALVIAPTRELVMQIEKDALSLGTHCPFRTVALFGGEDMEKQRRAVSGARPDLIVATPGRLLDFERRRYIDLGRVEILVIDEADRMLDMGFIPDVRRIVYCTPHKDKRQTMFYSATLSETVTRLAASWTKNPVEVNIDPEQVAVDSVNQVVYIVTAQKKFPLLWNILKHEHLQRVLLFANRRDTTARLTENLKRYGFDCALISGALPQNKRTRTLEAFRDGRVRILVATDVASRGLHVEGIGHVINYNVPVDAEDYVHRIGRTGRAGATGTSITFACEDEAMYIPDIEEYIGNDLPCTHPPDDWLRIPPEIKPAPAPRRAHPPETVGRGRRPQGGGGRRPQGGGRRPSQGRGRRR